ncbi:MAG: ABC transporter permease, partial [Planctomycetes bacterium]|nr:ABC transporter permease [Planctomycetota bacterium]
MTTTSTSGYAWTFQRLAGLDQVDLRTAEDFRHLGDLDPKLWVALSCPTAGLQFDPRTLALLDIDKDGRIRIAEVVKAVEWTCARLKDPGEIRSGRAALPLAAIDDTTEAGKRLVLTGRAILKSAGKDGVDVLTQEDVTRAAAHASEQMLNGDGILPPLAGLDPAIRQFIQDALTVTGGVEDASGDIGINRAIADAFVETLRDWTEWHTSVDKASSPLGDATPEAWELLSELKTKIDDYFLRCELVAYAPSSEDALNADENQIVTVDNGILSAAALEGLPLARVGADRPLQLH